MFIYTRRDTKETETYVTHGSNVSGIQRGQANPASHWSDNILSKIQYQLSDFHRLEFSAEHQNVQTNIEVRDSSITEGVIEIFMACSCRMRSCYPGS